MKLSLLDRICGRTKADVADRESKDAEVEASQRQRAEMKARAAIREARRRKATDTVFLEMKPDATVSSGMFNGALGLTNEELGLLPKPLLDEVIAVAQSSAE